MAQTNGAAAPSSIPGSPLIGSPKPNKKKPTKKDEALGSEVPAATPHDRAGTPLSTAAARPLPRSSAPSPAPSTSVAPPEHTDLASPTDSAGARTPLTNRPKRNPNTLFVNHLPLNVTEEEVRQFFGTSAEGVSDRRIRSHSGCLLIRIIRRSPPSRSRRHMDDNRQSWSPSLNSATRKAWIPP